MNSHVEARYYIIAFIDLLGTKERLTALESLEGASEQQQRKIICEAFFPPTYFRETFDKYLPQIIAGVSTSQTYQMFAELDIEIPAIKTFSFSDSIILSLPLLAKDKIEILFNLYPLLATINLASFVCASKGIFVQGGIELGIGVEIGRTGIGEVASDALVKATILEKEVGVPHIAVGEKFLSMLNNFSTIEDNSVIENPDDIIIHLNKWVAQKSLNMLIQIPVYKTLGPLKVLDFLHPNAIPGSLKVPEAIKEQTLSGIVANTEKALERYMDATYIYKYEYMKKYIISRIGEKEYKRLSK